jgi:hypothetical protein
MLCLGALATFFIMRSIGERKASLKS